jgi:hypothetical protein
MVEYRIVAPGGTALISRFHRAAQRFRGEASVVSVLSVVNGLFTVADTKGTASPRRHKGMSAASARERVEGRAVAADSAAKTATQDCLSSTSPTEDQSIVAVSATSPPTRAMSRSTSPQRTRAAGGSAIAPVMRVPETNVPFLLPLSSSRSVSRPTCSRT